MELLGAVLELLLLLLLLLLLPMLLVLVFLLLWAALGPLLGRCWPLLDRSQVSKSFKFAGAHHERKFIIYL